MAFSTIQGSGGAPDSFVGTSGVDSIALVNSVGNFDLVAKGANDVVDFLSAGLDPGVISGASARGGDGDDSIRSANGVAIFNGSLFNGNAGNDTLSFTAGLLSASSVFGGKGTDTITIGGGAVSSRINGNQDNDTIILQTVAVTNSSVFGGQGNDSIDVNIAASSSLLSGDDGNDTIDIANVNVIGATINGGAGNDDLDAADVVAANGGALFDSGEGADDVVGTQDGDTIVGGVGNDTITAFTGADLVSLGAGADLYGWAEGESVAFTATTLVANTAFANGATITWGDEVDIITDFASSLDSVIGADAATLTYITNVGDIAAAANFAIRGNFNATTGVFTTSTTGADSAVLMDATTADVVDGANIDDWVIFSGVGGGLLATDFIA